MTHYKVIKTSETWKNGVTMIAVLNTKSNKEHVGFIHPNGLVQIMVGMKAALKTIQLA